MGAHSLRRDFDTGGLGGKPTRIEAQMRAQTNAQLRRQIASLSRDAPWTGLTPSNHFVVRELAAR